MADYIINISSLQSRKSDLDSLKSKASNIYNEFASSTLANLGGEISSLSQKLKTPMERFNNGYKNSSTWLDGYISEFQSLESNLASFSGNTIDKPVLFSKKFTDIFRKVTIPMIQTKKETTDSTALNTDLNIDSNISATAYKNPANLSGYRLKFINSLIEGAISAYKKYGVLPSLTIAQAIEESGWGKSPIANNIFGMKAGSGWTGKKVKRWTYEQKKNGKYIRVKDWFRAYDSIAESVEDHAKLLTIPRYKRVIQSKNYKEACKAVKDCGYATSLTYTPKLLNIVEKYGLYQWDPK